MDKNAENPREVLIDPPNVKTNKVRRGRSDKVLFMRPSYTSIGDKFKPAIREIERRENRDYQI